MTFPKKATVAKATAGKKAEETKATNDAKGIEETEGKTKTMPQPLMKEARESAKSPLFGHRPAAHDLHLHDKGSFRKRVSSPAKDGDGDTYKLRILDAPGLLKTHLLKNDRYTIQVTPEEFKEQFEKA